MTLKGAGIALHEAHRAHAESFIRYKNADPKRTDGQARAMADLDVNLKRAEIEWEIAKRELDLNAMEFEARRLILLTGESIHASEPDPEDVPRNEGEDIYSPI